MSRGVRGSNPSYYVSRLGHINESWVENDAQKRILVYAFLILSSSTAVEIIGVLCDRSSHVLDLTQV